MIEPALTSEVALEPQAVLTPETHIITCEYPPQVGGVADFTRSVARRLAESGSVVHVWCPGVAGVTTEASGVVVHRELGSFSKSDLRRAGTLLDAFPSDRNLFLQWVPHGYGHRAMNIGLCLWLANRVNRHGDHLEVLVHEPFLPFVGSSFRVKMASVVQRLMTGIVLRSSRRVFVSTSSWIPRLRRYVPRGVAMTWLPVSSSVPVCRGESEVVSIRQRLGSKDRVLVGHFGTYGDSIYGPMSAIAGPLLASRINTSLLLIGRGSESACKRLSSEYPEFAGRIHASGTVDLPELSHWLQACDLMIQPYPDGVSARRTSVMAGLSHGVPTISTRGELTEALWESNGAVELVDVRDPREFVVRACRLVDSSALRQEVGERSRIMYETLFDVSVAAKILMVERRLHDDKSSNSRAAH